MIGAAAWSLVVLILAGWGLSELYRASVLRALDAELEVVLDGLAASLEPDGSAVRLRDTPNDLRFSRALSGRYWEVRLLAPKRAGGALRSRSLWDDELPLPSAELAALARVPGRTSFLNAQGPKDEGLRIAAVLVRLDRLPGPVLLTVGADRAPAARDAGRFTATLFASLAVLGAGLLIGVFLQVRVGLAPLNRVRADVADVRRGKRARLEGDYPLEVAPLTAELNALLDHNKAVVERARTHVGNLAHALKTPISVLLNEARAGEGPLADLVTRQAEGMARNVEHYLQRAQAVARAEAIGARTPVRAVLDDIARTLERLYARGRDMEILVESQVDCVFRGERQDLEEMAGNLMENACKYGGGLVRVRLRPEPEASAFAILVEDDGPGLSPGEQEVALRRGARLDESAPGQGLGLSITAELARAYGGTLSFSRADLGGLCARLRLPGAD